MLVDRISAQLNASLMQAIATPTQIQIASWISFYSSGGEVIYV